MVRPVETILYLDKQKASCLSGFLSSGSSHYTVTPKDAISYGEKNFTIYAVIPQKRTTDNGSSYPHVNLPVQFVGQYVTVTATDHKKDIYWPNTLMTNGLQEKETITAGKAQTEFIEQSTPVFSTTTKRKNYIETIQSNTSSQTPSSGIPLQGSTLQKEKTNIYTIQGPATPGFLRIKRYFYPGMTLYTSTGQKMPLIPIDGGMIGYGYGKLTLVYHKPLSAYIAYLISIGSMIYAARYLWRTQKHQSA